MGIVFQDDVDLVPTDITAALLLLKRQQEDKKEHIYQSLANQESVKLKAWMTDELAYHYIKFAVSSYGWSGQYQSQIGRFKTIQMYLNGE